MHWGLVDLTLEQGDYTTTGALGGAQLGYNWHNGGVLFGVEASLSGGTFDGDVPSTVPGVTFGSDIQFLTTVTARLGVATDRWLTYAKAGFAAGYVEVFGTNSFLPDAFSESDFRVGWTAGAGMEFLVSRNVSLGLEYAYIDLGKDSYSGTTNIGIPFRVEDVEVQIHAVTARLNYRFGW